MVKIIIIASSIEWSKYDILKAILKDNKKPLSFGMGALLG